MPLFPVANEGKSGPESRMLGLGIGEELELSLTKGFSFAGVGVLALAVELGDERDGFGVVDKPEAGQGALDSRADGDACNSEGGSIVSGGGFTGAEDQERQGSIILAKDGFDLVEGNASVVGDKERGFGVAAKSAMGGKVERLIVVVLEFAGESVEGEF